MDSALKNSYEMGQLWIKVSQVVMEPMLLMGWQGVSFPLGEEAKVIYLSIART